MRAVIAAALLFVVCLDSSCVKVAAKSVITAKQVLRSTEDEMRVILDTYNIQGSLLCNKLSQANWDVQTHVDSADQYSPIQVSDGKMCVSLVDFNYYVTEKCPKRHII